MNDRFKFRAWDELNKIMHYDFQFIRDWSNGGWIIFQSDKQKLGWNASDKFTLNVYPNPYFAEQLKIQQATGLKDKNGKLIYEGDICEYEFEEIGKQKAIIEFNTKYAAFLIKPLNDFQYANINDCEVIGNKFENPELLKECE